jgi:hypothetical protein
MRDWAIAFAVTCMLELVVVSIVVRRFRPGIVLGAQVATHPLVWLLFTTLPIAGLARLAIVEAFAVVVEAALYRRYLVKSTRDALALSAFANATSLAIGAVVVKLIWWLVRM